MFDKTFFKFALGFTAIVAVSMCALYLTGEFSPKDKAVQTASIR